MRFASIEDDGWQLDNGEAYRADAPDTFWIPDLSARQNLQVGDFAKLIFRIEFEDDATVERMWVIVTRRQEDGSYLGILDNEPTSLIENERLWLGSEVPFETRHIINIQPGDEASVALAGRPPRIVWR